MVFFFVLIISHVGEWYKSRYYTNKNKINRIEFISSHRYIAFKAEMDLLSNERLLIFHSLSL